MFIYSYCYMILTLVEVQQHNLYYENFLLVEAYWTLCVKDSMPVKKTICDIFKNEVSFI